MYRTQILEFMINMVLKIRLYSNSLNVNEINMKIIIIEVTERL